jgi:cytochrome c peroxidase
VQTRRFSLLLLAAGLLLTAVVLAWRWMLPAGVSVPPTPADNPMTAAKVELGRRLFYDADLSADGTMSCATCHEQKHAFADAPILALPTSPGGATFPGWPMLPGSRR